MRLTRFVLGGAAASLVATTAFSALPEDALQLLEQIPGRRLSLPFVVKRAASSSDSFHAASAAFISTDADRLQARSALAWRPFVRFQQLDDRREPTNPFSPSRIQNSQLSLGVSTQFETGTQLQAEVSHGSNGLRFNDFPPGSLDYFETRASLTLSQKLWNDAFGTGTRAGLVAADKASEAASVQARIQLEEWATGIIRLYYAAWLSQSQGNAARMGLDRKKRLKSVMEILVRRGTAESPDRLQVDAALAASEIQWEQASLSLQDQWRQLVVALKLPESIAAVDPFEIPVDLDDPLEAARNQCGTERALAQAPEPKEVLQARLLSEAASLQLKQATTRLRPEVDLNLSVFSNGIDSAGGNALSEGARWLHPGYLAGVTVSLPIGFHAEKAQALQASAQQLRADAQGRIAADRSRTDWVQRCLELYRMDRAAASWGRAARAQELRAQEEEKRLKIGRTGMFQVIQAGDDATQALLALDAVEVERRLNAWQVLRLAGQMSRTLELSEAQVNP